MKLIGPEWVDIAFQTARQIDPEATLILNQTDNHRMQGTYTNQTREIANRLKQNGLIDVVGIQMHILYNEWSPVPTKEDVKQTILSYGLPVAITEFDVNLTLVPGTLEEKYKYQSDVYKDMIGAALETGRCISVGFWGVSDADSWYTRPLGMLDARATMWDDNYQPKPAYFAVRKVLLERLAQK